jgi:uncharacterized protein YoxC
MMFGPSSEVNSTIQRIKSEIETLKRQQAEALKAATYLGLTPTEAKAQEDRRAKITKLVRDLSKSVEQISQLH